MKTLRGKLVTWLIVALTLAGVMGGLAAYGIGLHEPDEEFDGQLRQLAIYIGEGAARPSDATAEGADIEDEDVMLIQIWDRGGRVIQQSNPAISVPRQLKSGFATIAVNGANWRVYTSIRADRIVQIAQRMDMRLEIAALGALRAIYPIAALIPVSWLLISFIVGRVLRPLRQLIADLAKRQATNGSALPVAGLPGEIVPLVEAVNTLLARQQALLDFRQRFLSDTAHQLRTPLTAAKLQADNLRHVKTLAEARDLASDIEGGLRRMADMINQLLDLARADAPDRPLPSELHDLNDIMREALEDVLTLADRRAIDIGVTAQAVAPIRCDRREIRMLIGNLLDNAVRYTPLKGQVDVALEVAGTAATVSVTDTGPGIHEADIGHLYDRFTRFGTADTEGSGLGLAIVKAIANRHAAGVDVTNRQDRPGLKAAVIFQLEKTAA